MSDTFAAETAKLIKAWSKKLLKMNAKAFERLWRFWQLSNKNEQSWTIRFS